MEIRCISWFFAIALALVPFQMCTKAEKVLVLSFFASQSHKNVYDPLLRALVNRGHDLTIVSPIKSSLPAGKVKEINGVTFPDLMKEGYRIFPNNNVFESRLNKTFIHSMSLNLVNLFEKVCESYYGMAEVKALLKERFDLVVVSSFMNECTYGLVHKLNSSFVFVHPHGAEPWKTAFTGAPVPPSFVPMFYFGGTDRMSFVSRVKNTLSQFGSTLWYYYGYLPKLEQVYRKHLGEETPSVTEIEKKASLILMNRHFTLNYPRPQMPQMVEIAGMHCRPGEPLPKDLEKFVDSSGNEGFIYFNMGSIVPMSMMPENIRKVFVNVFSKLKQKVIWKWESEKMEDLPKNVLLRKWFPQQDILGHPKIRLFITHGGMLSTEEAVYHGVPLLGFPLYGDQDWNLQVSQTQGFAISLELRELTEEILESSINRILKETTFKEKVKHLSSIFKDRPQKPLDLAVFWTEYVMRHKGARHLHSPGADLNFFQYFSIDVVVFLLTSILGVLILLITTIKILFCRKRSVSPRRNISSKTKKMNTKKNK